MKLLFDCTELSYLNENSGHKAGVYFVALNLLRMFLSNKNVEITFYCDYKRYYFMKEVLQNNFCDIKLLKENSVVNRFMGKLLYLTQSFPLTLKYALIILARFYEAFLYKVNKANYCQINEFDIYFSPCTPPSKEIQESALLKFRMLHDVIPVAESGISKFPKAWYYKWYYKIYSTLNERDFYVTNSEYTRKDVLKYFPFISETHIKTTLLGANESFRPSEELSPIKEKYIFSLCSLGKRKNLEFAIRNFYKFIEKNNINDLKLVLGGSVWAKYQRVLDIILDKYDRSKVVLTGYIDEKELAKYYSNSLCFIYPSLYEGFGLPVLEAMQCGCPVITSGITSLPEVIGDAGIQINPNSDEDMIKAYEKMYFDENFRKECREKGINRAKQFSWEKCAEEILDFINNTLTK